tara:strand:- start:390 stop:1076 length:687 start_codon:yes stop_codon:yes gene_type:complete
LPKKLQFCKTLAFVGTGLILSSLLAADDFWSKAMDIHYQHRVALFNSLKIKQGSKVFIGDSITEQCIWNELFGDNRLINRGIGGDITEKVLNRLDFLDGTKPSTVFLMIGTNDLGQNKSLEEIINNYQKIIQELSKKLPDAVIYMQSVLPINQNLFFMKRDYYTNENIDLLNVMIQKLVKENVRYLELNKFFKDKNGNLDIKYSSDGLHLNGDGYQKWKDIFIESNII